MYEAYRVGAVVERERFDYFRAVVDSVFCPMQVCPGEGYDPGCDGVVEATSVGDVRLARVAMGPCTVTRTTRDVARLTDAPYLVKFQTRGEALWSQCGREVHLRAGDFVVASMAEAYTLKFHSDFEMPVLAVPPVLMRTLTPDPDAFLGMRMSGEDADCGLLSSFVAQVVSRMGRLQGPMVRKAEATILDLLAGVLATRSAQARVSPANLLAQIKVYIEQHLPDRALSPALVAHTFGISVRQLHLLFEREALSMGQYLRGVRLRVSRELLRDRPDKSLTDIAMECGFYDLSHLTRCFRAQFGESPGAFRAAAQQHALPVRTAQ